MAKRLFLGLELPAVCQDTLARLDPHLRGLRWVREKQIHLTLSFLGDVEFASAERLHEAFATVAMPPFFLPIRGLGSFGGSRPSVLWAGVGKGHPHLFGLHKRLQDAVLRAGLEPDLRPFHPHITIARARDVSAASLKPLLRHHAETEFGMWEVKEFTLFSSVLSHSGSTYTVEMKQSIG